MSGRRLARELHDELAESAAIKSICLHAREAAGSAPRS